MVLPKRCCVIACERRAIASNCPPAAGELNCAKSSSVSDDFANDSRTAPGTAPSERFTSEDNGKELNSATKLTLEI